MMMMRIAVLLTAISTAIASCPTTLDLSVEIDDGSMLYYAIVPPYLCGRLEVEHEDGEGWIGLGFSGSGTMDGGWAIVGIPAEATVLKYDLFHDIATAMDTTKQTLTGTSITSSGDGLVVMEFVTLMEEDGEVPILVGENPVLFSYGGAEFGMHTHDAHPTITLETRSTEAVATDDTVATDDVENETYAPTSVAVENDDVEMEEMEVEVDEEEEEGEDGATIGMVETLLSSDGMFETQLSPDLLLRYRINVPDTTTQEICDGCTITMETVYDGEAWVGIAFSNNGQMVGSEAVIGIPDGQKVPPRKYHQYSYALCDVVPMDTAAQTLTDATVTIDDVGRTIMKFTKLMKEAGEIEISMVGEMGFLWAVGSSIELGYHQSRSPFAISLSTGLAQEIKVPNMTAWLVHGILAFVAWGVLIPFAIDSSLFRSMLPKKQGSSGSSSSKLWFNLHRTLNTTAFALFIALFSIAVAVTAKEGGDHFFNSHEKVGLIMFIITTLQVVSGIFRPRLPPPESVDEVKTTARKGWEGGHRLLGVGLLACGFWQMQDGIELYVMKYSISEENESKVVIAYWAWIGLMTATIILGLFVSTKHKGAANQQNRKEQPIDETEEVNG